MNIYHRFYEVFLRVLLGIFLLIASFNIFVDPYGVVNSPTLRNFNYSKPAKNTQVRLFKALDVIHLKPKTIFLGTSRVDLGLDPKSAALINQQPAYNLGLPQASMYEVLHYFRHALSNNKNLKEVVIGLDFHIMFNKDLKATQEDYNSKRLEKNSLIIEDAIKVIFSINALNDSIETIHANINNTTNPYLQDGRRSIYYEPLLKDHREQFKKKINSYLRLYKKYHLSHERLKDLQDIVNLCKANNIDLKMFVEPLHATQEETIRVSGLWSDFEQWKHELVKITPVWDFSGYNSMTTEPISNHMKYYFESSHYRKELGDLVLNRMFAYQDENIPSDFGVVINKDNIESHLAKIRADREVWAKNNIAEVKLVEDIKHQVKK